MKRIIKYIVLVMFLNGLLLVLTGCCSHTWIEANCTTPKTCSQCGKTEGGVVHEFGETNCNEIRICKKCGIEEEPLGHVWKKATCTEPKLCKKCGETKGEALGHTTIYGKCSRCNKDIDDVEHKGNFIVVTSKDTEWMQEQEDFVRVYVSGTIEEITKMNDIIIVDLNGGKWTAGVGTGCDFSQYIGTTCEVYGTSSGKNSETHNDMPYINIGKDDSHIVFSDGKVLYPGNFESEEQFKQKQFQDSSIDKTVWIPTNGGKKYHRLPNCSKMEKPQEISREEAERRGYISCDKCW